MLARLSGYLANPFGLRDQSDASVDRSVHRLSLEDTRRFAWPRGALWGSGARSDGERCAFCGGLCSYADGRPLVVHVHPTGGCYERFREELASPPAWKAAAALVAALTFFAAIMAVVIRDHGGRHGPWG